MASGARPALPGGHELGDQLYFTGPSQSVEDGDKVVHGQSGEIVGLTALHIAAARGDVAMCRALLDAGADPTRRDAMGMSALEHARWWMSGSAEGHACASYQICSLHFC